MMRAYVTLIAVLAVATGALGCGSSSSGDDSGTSAPIVTNDQACADYSHAACARLESCAPFLREQLWTDVAACESRVVLTCGHIFTDKGAQVDAPTLDHCASVLMGLSCPDFFAFLTTGQTPAACNAPMGTLADGSPCEDSSQCVNRECKKTDDKVPCGVCAPTPKPGDVCVIDNNCPSGTLCAAGVCATTSGAGGTCDSSHPCQVGIPCVNGTCATPKPAGSSCTYAMDHDECDVLTGSFCHPKTGVCTAVTIAGPGAPCGGGEYTICGASGHCNGGTATTAGTCGAAAADGAACDDMMGPVCTSPAKCVSGVCQTTFTCQ